MSNSYYGYGAAKVFNNTERSVIVGDFSGEGSWSSGSGGGGAWSGGGGGGGGGGGAGGRGGIGGSWISGGTITSEKIYEAHCEIRELITQCREAKACVAQIKQNICENWVGKGRNEFESQYQRLICKIEDFYDILLDLYDGLVDAEAQYQATDDSIRQSFVKAVSQE